MGLQGPTNICRGRDLVGQLSVDFGGKVIAGVVTGKSIRVWDLRVAGDVRVDAVGGTQMDGRNLLEVHGGDMVGKGLQMCT